jgi:hypothetical protein
MSFDSKLAEKILRDVPPSRLFAAAGLMRQRAGVSEDTLHNQEIDLDAFIASLDLRQLRLLRRIAMSLDHGIEPVH